MAKLTESELKKQIKAKQFSKVYLLYGKEQMFVRHYSDKLVEAVAGKELNDFGFHVFKGEVNLNQFDSAVNAISFLSEYNCVLASDIRFDELLKSEQNTFLEIVKSTPEGTVLIISMPSYVPVKSEAFFKSLVKLVEKLGSVCEFGRLNAAALERYIAKWANQNDKLISHLNASRLIEYCGEDLNLLKNEVNKLCAYASGEEITLEDIDKLCAKRLEANIFELSSCIFKQDSTKAFNLLDTLLYQNVAPENIIARLCDAYVDAYRMRVADECAVSSETVAKDFAYKNRAFVLKKSRTATYKIGTSALRKSLDVLFKADISQKSSSVKSEMILTQVIAELLLAAKERD